MKKWIVYKHTSPSNKVYIGITCKSTTERWGSKGQRYLQKYKSGGFIQPVFANAIIKYGWNNFKHEILYKDLSEKEACEYEKALIKTYKEQNLSYNICAGGNGTYQCSEVTKEKLRKVNLGKHLSEEVRMKISLANKGKPKTEEFKRHLSEIKKGKPVSEATLNAKIKAKQMPLEIDGIKYSCYSEALKHLQISERTLGRRLNDANFPNYKRLK